MLTFLKESILREQEKMSPNPTFSIIVCLPDKLTIPWNWEIFLCFHQKRENNFLSLLPISPHPWSLTIPLPHTHTHTRGYRIKKQEGKARISFRTLENLELNPTSI